MRYIPHNTFSKLVEAISRQSWTKAKRGSRRTTGRIKVPLNASEMLTKLAEAAAELEGVERALRDIQVKTMTSPKSGTPTVDFSSIQGHVKWMIKHYYSREMRKKLHEFLPSKGFLIWESATSQDELLKALSSASGSMDLVRVGQAAGKARMSHARLGQAFVITTGMRGDSRGTTQGAQGSLT